MSHGHEGDEDPSAIERALWEGYDRHPAEPTEDHEEHRKFWDALHGDLEKHAAHMEKHARKAKRLAEVVRTIITTKKFAGRTAPKQVSYTQTVTRKSDTPFKKV